MFNKTSHIAPPPNYYVGSPLCRFWINFIDFGAILNTSLRRSRRRLKQSIINRLSNQNKTLPTPPLQKEGIRTRHAEFISASHGIPSPVLRTPSPRGRGDKLLCAKHDKNLSTYHPNVLETNNTPLPLRGNRKVAFTLAEVLITLGIIGVVAAITIPTLVNKHQEQVTVTKLKKINNLIQNAERLSIIENGDTTAWETYTDFGLGANSAYAYFEKYYLPYINKTIYTIGNGRKNYIQKAANLSGETDKGHRNPADEYLDFADGSCLIFYGNNQFALMTYDVNCEKGPNIMGKDIWDIAEFYWYFYAEKNNGCPNGCHVAQITALNQPNLEQLFNDKCLNYNGQGGAPNLCFTYLVKDNYDFKKFKERY